MASTRFGRTFWFALLLPQFAGLLCVAVSELRWLRRDLQSHGGGICGNTEIPFSAPLFALAVLGLMGVVGLCGRRPWARWGYGAFALVFLGCGAEPILHPPTDSPSLLPLVLIVVCTLLGCFVRPTRDDRLGGAVGATPSPR